MTDLRVSLLTPALVARGVYPYLLQAFRKLVTLVRPAKIYVSTKRLFKFIFDGLSKVAGDSKLASSCKSVFRKVFAGKSDNKGFSFFKNVFQKPFEWMIQKITPFFKFIWKPLRWLILGSILFFKFLFKKFLKGLKILVDPSSLKSEVFQVLAVLFFSLLLIVGLPWAMMVDTGFGTFHQGKLFSLVFIFLSMLSIIWALEMPEAKQRIRLFVVVILLDFFTFHHMVQTVTVASTEDFQPKEHAQAGKKDIPAPDLSATDNFNLFSPDQFGSYAPWDESQLYHPDKIKYPTLGNQSFYELKSNSTPEVHNMVSGVTLPRLFLADFAVEDPSEEITRRVFHDPSTSSHLGNIIYLNEKISQGRDLLI